MDIFVVCDYSIPSVAYDACVFADALAEVGFRARIVSSGKVYRGISQYWDPRVTRFAFDRSVREIVFLQHDDYPQGDYGALQLAMELATVFEVPLTFASWDMEDTHNYPEVGDKQIVSYLRHQYPEVPMDPPECYEDIYSIRLHGMLEDLRLFGVDKRSLTYGLSVPLSKQFTVDYTHCDTANPRVAILITSALSSRGDDRLFIEEAANKLLAEGTSFTVLSRKLHWLPSHVRHLVSSGQCEYRSFDFFDDIPLMLQGFCGCIVGSAGASVGCLASVVSRVPVIPFSRSGFQGLLFGAALDHFVDKITAGS